MKDVVTTPSRVTHLVTRTVTSEDTSYRLCLQTMKYLKSLVQGVQIVDAKWVTDSLARGTAIQQLSPYRIHGTTRDVWMKATERARADCWEHVITFISIADFASALTQFIHRDIPLCSRSLRLCFTCVGLEHGMYALDLRHCRDGNLQRSKHWAKSSA